MKIRNARDLGYTHAEAFFHMRYFGMQGENKIYLRIWNSRDGVTPFTTYSEEYGISLQHVDWGEDYFDKDYKPKKGDLIWISHTETTAKIDAERVYKMYEGFLAEISGITSEERIEKFGYDNKSQLEMMIADKDKFIKETIHRILYENGESEPRLELVKEDWI